ncbi:MAG: hypothetical protein ABI672_04330 [Vicinamibacteria bacterium]
MSFGIYIVGAILAICGLVYGANLMHVPGQWIVVGALIILGLAVLSGVQSTRQKDPPA